jgi:hypothetical protein
MKALKKLSKASVKRRKKELKALKKSSGAGRRSPAVAFAESVRGIIYLILGVSLVVSLILSQEGYIITLEDIVGSLFFAGLGKIILAVVALAFVIYGLKHLGAIR